MNITVLGIGYVGLVTGTCLAEIGNDVVCFDVDREKIDLLGAGGSPFHERDLPELIARNVAFGRLSFSADVAAAVRHGDLIFIATGTPAGVGAFRDPPVFMRPGDEITIEIEGIGALTNPVRSA